MSVDILQEKIRKMKNPSILELALPLSDLPPQFAKTVEGYTSFCCELLEALQGTVPAVRVSFAVFSLMDGLNGLRKVLSAARELGWYVLLDAPEISSTMLAQITADILLGESTVFPCDGLVISGYAGSDMIKPFLPYCKKQNKDIFVITRTANKSAPELQDLLCGTRLVHEAAADHVNRYIAGTEGKCGYARVGILASASSAGSLRTLRAKYNRLFFLLDGLDYPNANAKNCSFAFDKFGHGAAACVGNSVLCAWKQTESDGSDYLVHALAAAERTKKNLTRYITIL